MLSKLGAAALYQVPSSRLLFLEEVLAMTLWDELDGRTWSERAGSRAAGAQPRRRRRQRRLARLRRQARTR
jgi:hypothetical protein